MADGKTARNYIEECALHQNGEGVLAQVYDGLSDEDRIALARMTTDADGYDATRWVHPPEEL